MTMDGGCDPDQIDHENTSKEAHIKLKVKLKDRRGTYVFIPHDGRYDFTNDFSKIPLVEAPFFHCGRVPEIRHEGIEPEDWDRGGGMASYSAGSEVAELRTFKRNQGTARRGPKRKSDDDSGWRPDVEDLPPLSPPGQGMERELMIEKVSWEEYRRTLIGVREAAKHIKRWGVGAEGREQWKNTPISVRTILDEGEADATLLDSAEAKVVNRIQEEPVLGGPRERTRKTQLPHDLRRYTVNSHPALARALAKVLQAGDRCEIMDLMNKTLPSVIRKFEKVTGRIVIGASIHWDSSLPHFNLWHTGLEKVLYKKGKGKDRIRFRRTAMNLGSSGPGLRAWRRVELAFDRLGKDFCHYTAAELRKEEGRLEEAQGRMPGDWAINQVADEVLENLLVDAGYQQEVEEGFREFVENEEARYAAGMAGKLALNERAELSEEISRLQEIIDHQDTELENRKSSLDAVDGKLVLVEKDLDGARGELTRVQNDFSEATSKNAALKEDLELVKQQKDEEIKRVQEISEQRKATRMAELQASADGAETLKTKLAVAVHQLNQNHGEKLRVEARLVDATRNMASLESELSGAVQKMAILEKEQKEMGIRMKALEAAANFGKLLKAEVQDFLKSVLKSPKTYSALGNAPAVWKCLEKIANRIGIDLGPEMK